MVGIDVTSPYFAYGNIRTADDGSVFARVPVQQPLGNERGPISAAEASRHLAILGACACAAANPVKHRHYYLVSNAVYERMAEPMLENTVLYARADCFSVNSKKAEASTELYDDYGTTLAVLRLSYQVILDDDFARLYKNNFIAQPDFKIENPYRLIHGFKNETMDEQHIACSMGTIPEHYCAGHFPQFPALPVTMLMSNLCRMVCKLAAQVIDSLDARYTIKRYDMVVDHLAFAGDNVELMVQYIDTTEEDLLEFMAEGIANGDKSVGKITLFLANRMGKLDHAYSAEHTHEAGYHKL